MPARPNDPQWLKDAYADGRITERVIRDTNSRVIGVGIDLGIGDLIEESETDFEKRLVGCAQSLGWVVMAVRRNVSIQRADGSVHHATPWLYDGEGWLDLTFVRERVFFAELKSEKGRIRPAQQVWLDRLKAAGQECYLWRPSDWPQIEKVLK
jgi:hypothetical protein